MLQPPFSVSRFISAIMVAYFWGQLIMMAIPEDEIYGINWNHLQWLIPLGVGMGRLNLKTTKKNEIISAFIENSFIFYFVGVTVVGNIGREKGKPWIPIAVAYISYLVRYQIYDENVWFTLMVFSSATAFDSYAKEWRRERPKKRSLLK